jgi:hypothetical protein
MASIIRGECKAARQTNKKKAALSKWHKLLEATVQLGKVKFSS